MRDPLLPLSGNTVWKLGTDNRLHLPAHILYDATSQPFACTTGALPNVALPLNTATCSTCVGHLTARIQDLKEVVGQPHSERELRAQVEWWANEVGRLTEAHTEEP